MSEKVVAALHSESGQKEAEHEIRCLSAVYRLLYGGTVESIFFPGHTKTEFRIDSAAHYQRIDGFGICASSALPILDRGPAISMLVLILFPFFVVDLKNQPLVRGYGRETSLNSDPTCKM